MNRESCCQASEPRALTTFCTRSDGDSESGEADLAASFSFHLTRGHASESDFSADAVHQRRPGSEFLAAADEIGKRLNRRFQQIEFLGRRSLQTVAPPRAIHPRLCFGSGDGPIELLGGLAV